MPQPLSKEQKQKWKEKILTQQKSRTNAFHWCRDNGENYNAFLYWKRKLFPKTIIKRDAFVEITEKAKETGITLEYQGIRVQIERHFDSSTLKQCLQVLKETLC